MTKSAWKIPFLCNVSKIKKFWKCQFPFKEFWHSFEQIKIYLLILKKWKNMTDLQIRTIVQVSSGKYLFLKISEICKKRIRSCLNKDTRTVLFTSFWCCYCELWTFFTPFFSVSFADFEHVSVSWKSSSLYNFDLFMFFDTWKTKSTYICQFRSSCSGQSNCNFGSRM